MPLHNLPTEVASFIGRERELNEIERLLARSRLLTLTGAGGCGKTRLALHLATSVARGFPDGVWLAQLAPISDSALVPRAVAAALGIRGAAGRPLLATLALALAPRRLLLILDNCEHLAGACARLAETLLRACPHLTILATSREPLHIQGETIWRAPSLEVPAADPLHSLEALAQIEAVALFLDRARARQPAFTLTPDNAPAVVAICRRLEGLPLGIELAAAQIGSLAPEQIASRLDNSLWLLGGGSRTLPRQETLRATLDWSHALLREDERTLFRRLAVFAGSFSAEAAERVCDDAIAQSQALPTLLALVEKSLVEPQAGARETRYRLLEPVRQYAWAQLEEQVELESAQRRHARVVLDLAETAEPWLMSGARGAWMERLTLEQDNIRAALSWSQRCARAEDVEIGLRLVGALLWYWVFRGELSEGLERVEAALAKSADVAPAVRLKALYVSGELVWSLGQHALARARLETCAAAWRAMGEKRNLAYTLQVLSLVIAEPQASDLARESLRLFQEVGDAWGAAHATFSLATLSLLQSGGAAAHAQLEDTLACWRALGDEWGMAQTLNYLGDLAREQGDDASATERYRASLALLQRQRMTGTIPSIQHNLGYLALRSGRPRQGLRLFRESLTLFRNQGDQRGMAECLVGLAGALGALKQPERAARLFGAADALLTALDAAVWPANVADYARFLARVREQLGEQSFAAAFGAGQAAPLEQIVALTEEDLEQSSGSDDTRELTRREREVARLIAQGMTNRQIGAALVITEGTARLHVKHILHKLGFVSRAQIAVWAVEHGLIAEASAL